jgi:hypothetical protein
MIASRHKKSSPTKSFLAGLLSESLCNSFSAMEWCFTEEDDYNNNIIPNKYHLPNDRLKYPKDENEAGNTDSESSSDEENDGIKPLSRQAIQIQSFRRCSNKRLKNFHEKNQNDRRTLPMYCNDLIYAEADDDTISTLTNVFTKMRNRRGRPSLHSRGVSEDDLNKLLGPFDVNKHDLISGLYKQKNKNQEHVEKEKEGIENNSLLEIVEEILMNNVDLPGDKDTINQETMENKESPQSAAFSIEGKKAIKDYRLIQAIAFNMEKKKSMNEEKLPRAAVSGTNKKKSRRQRAIKKVKKILARKKSKNKKEVDTDTDDEELYFQTEEEIEDPNRRQTNLQKTNPEVQAHPEYSGQLTFSNIDIFEDIEDPEDELPNIKKGEIQRHVIQEQEKKEESYIYSVLKQRNEANQLQVTPEVGPNLYSTKMHFFLKKEKCEQSKRELRVPLFQEKETHQMVLQELSSLLDAAPPIEQNDFKEVKSNEHSPSLEMSKDEHGTSPQQSKTGFYLEGGKTSSRKDEDDSQALKSILKKENATKLKRAIKKVVSHERVSSPPKTDEKGQVPSPQEMEEKSSAGVPLEWFDGDAVMNVFDWIGRCQNYRLVSFLYFALRSAQYQIIIS